MYNYAKLNGRIKEKAGSQGALAKAVGISENSMSRKLNGYTDFTQKEIFAISEMLDISSADVGTYFFTLDTQKLECQKETQE